MSAGNNFEEIKLQIENVKMKKVEGTLYLMSERIGWIPKQKSSFTVCHNYVDIKTQKISTEGKVKIQLQIVLHDDTSSTFHFVSPTGPEQQLKDRDQVKDMLGVLLPKFKQKINQELEEKKRILIENPHIYQLYSDLVVGQLIPAEEFWSNFVDINDYKQEAKNQPTGVSQGFMANICPKSDGSGLIYNITHDDIQSIFKTYPTVRLKYIQNVPQKMSESDFWTKFFQSYYFRRDQSNTVANDIFSDCSAKDEEEIRIKTDKALVGPIAVIGTQKNDFSSGDGFGLTDFSDKKNTNVANQNLIKRYNYYSMRVLSSMEESSKTRDEEQRSKASSVSLSRPAKKFRLDEEIVDLEKEDESNYSMHLRGAPLNLTHIDRYFYAPKSSNETNQMPLINSAFINKTELCQSTLDEMREWSMDIKNILNPSLALAVLVKLSPGSQLMQTTSVHNFKDEIPKVNQDELKAVYFSSIEILKAFHRMFPPKNTEQEIKLKSMKEAVETFYQQKILVLQDRLFKENSPWNLTTHLESMFKIAIAKYSAWKQKQGS